MPRIDWKNWAMAAWMLLAGGIILLGALNAPAKAQEAVTLGIQSQDSTTGGIRWSPINSGNPLPTSAGSPSGGTFTFAGCTVGAASGSCLATATAVNHVQIQNTSPSANIACRWGGTAALNSNTSIQLSPGQSSLWGPSTSGIPSGALNCIASAASTPLYLEYN